MHESHETEGAPVVVDAVESAHLILVRERTNIAYQNYQQLLHEEKLRLHSLEDGFMIAAGLGVAISGLFHRPKLLAIGAGSLLAAFGADSLREDNRDKAARIEEGLDQLLQVVWKELIEVGIKPVKAHPSLSSIATEHGIVQVITSDPEAIELRYTNFSPTRGQEGGAPADTVLEPGLRYGSFRLEPDSDPQNKSL